MYIELISHSNDKATVVAELLDGEFGGKVQVIDWRDIRSVDDLYEDEATLYVVLNGPLQLAHTAGYDAAVCAAWSGTPVTRRAQAVFYVGTPWGVRHRQATPPYPAGLDVKYITWERGAPRGHFKAVMDFLAEVAG